MTTTDNNANTAAAERQRPKAIRLETTLPAAPERVYELLTDSALFAAATGRPADIGPVEGDRFSLFGGHVGGRQIELVPGVRIVQTWRGMDWPAGVHSLVRFTLKADGAGTRLTMDHDAYPEGSSPLYASWREHLAVNWPVFYFEPLEKYLAN